MDLNQALINYGLDFLRKKGYKKIQAPFLMKKEIMAQTAQLEEFDEALYKVSLSTTGLQADNQVTGDTDDKYLIATSEQPISGMHSDEFLEPKTLPLRWASLPSFEDRADCQDTPDTRHVFGKKQAPTAKTHGASSVCINSRRSSRSVFRRSARYASDYLSSSFAIRKSPQKSSSPWWTPLRNSTNLSSYHIEWSASSRAH